MKIKAASNTGIKRLQYCVFASALAFACLSNAEPMEPGELRSMVWKAAQEIENGNVDAAADMLNKAAAADNQPADVSALIGRLQSNLKELQLNPAAEVAKSEPQAQPAPEEVGMSKQEMETYIDSLSDAVDSMFE